MAAADAVTGMDSRLEVTWPGDRPAWRSAARTAETVASVGPNLGPNCPAFRKWWNTGDCRFDRLARKAVSAAWSRTLSVTSRWILVPADSGPSLTAPRGKAGTLPVSATGAVEAAGAVEATDRAMDGAAEAIAPLKPSAPATPTVSSFLPMFIFDSPRKCHD